MVKPLALIFSFAIAFLTTAEAASPTIDAATTLFSRFEVLNAKFDQTVETLYSDRAIICIVVLPTNPRQETTMSSTVGLVYRAMIVTSMAAAKARGDINFFRNVTYQEISSTQVAVRGKRISKLKSYSTPFYMEISYLEGRWFITKEVDQILSDK